MIRRTARLMLAAGLLFAAAASAPRVEAGPRPEVFPASNRLFMISDSVGLGAIPQMTAAFGPTW